MSGGSYSGALTAWLESVSPGTFWAYHSTSAPVEAIYDYVSSLKAPTGFNGLLTISFSGNTLFLFKRECQRTAVRMLRAW